MKKNCPTIPLEQFRKLGVKLKFEDFQVTTLEKSAVSFSQETFKNLIQQVWERCNGRSVRLVGLHVAIPEEKSRGQMELWES